MKAYLVRNVHDLTDALKKLEKAFAQKGIYFLRVIRKKDNLIRITILEVDQDSATIKELDFIVKPEDKDSIKFYQLNR